MPSIGWPTSAAPYAFTLGDVSCVSNQSRKSLHGRCGLATRMARPAAVCEGAIAHAFEPVAPKPLTAEADRLHVSFVFSMRSGPVMK